MKFEWDVRKANEREQNKFKDAIDDRLATD